ncbi:glyoxylate reductase/hydroxypyruvate reductase-like isoform X2 [Babylonia areolata]|uniref:glyoxylate reductase/hydroxypyruvate reductase-like isoform X2 n=1 Tax=Babylonia areolata TaxID=304850 RepID=UPI003FD3861F
MSFKVYITRKLPEDEVSVLKKKSDKLNISTWESENVVPRDELLKNVAGAHGVLCTITDKIDGEFLDAAGSQLKVISTVSSGMTHIDLAECKKRNVQVYNTPDMASDSAAEFAVTMVLLVARRSLDGMDAVVRGEWGLWKPMWICGFEMGGRTLGIVGFGRVGFGVARRLKPFNIKEIIYYDVCEKEFGSSIGAKRVQKLDDLLTQSDIVCICCAATPSTIKSSLEDTVTTVNSVTEDMKPKAFNKDAFAKMKEGSILINTARGQILDHDALDEALKAGRPMAAGLDVTDPEPLPASHPLMSNPKCIITPHLSTATWPAIRGMTKEAATNLQIALLGGGGVKA